MLGRRKRRFDAVTAAVLAVSFGFALLGAVAFHTDDGCAVELHCFACHWSLASTGVVALTIAPILPVEFTGRIIPVEDLLPAEISGPASASRGPPSA
jgi:hypothetical protein